MSHAKLFSNKRRMYNEANHLEEKECIILKTAIIVKITK